jgi:hypothetical protein
MVMKRLSRVCVLLAYVSSSALLFAQQADDTQAGQPNDSADVLAEVQQLKADVERLSQEVERLDNEVRRLQTTQGLTGSTPTPKPRPVRTASTRVLAPVTATAAATPQAEEAPLVTTLLFHDGRRIETRNYAIIGESIWVYTEQESKKYRLADLDVEGTKKANSDRGVLFQLPPAR